ncbi:MAG: glycosyltransferase family 4 protein [Proteobacteria bacterium]|nr:glycosyltransferase family 4 protein [Pseudomonadota bacterium]
MRLVFFIKSVANPGGGAERVLSQVASGLAKRGHEVTVASSDDEGSLPYYPLDPSVELIFLGVGKTSRTSTLCDVAKRMRAFRKTVCDFKPDAIVGFMHSTFIPLGLSLFGTKSRLVASEHIGPEHYRPRPLQWLLLQLTPILCESTTVVSEQIRLSFNSWLRRRMVVIPNPVSIVESPSSHHLRDEDRPVILSVGRLAEQKDHRTLISAFARVAEHNPHIRLRIAGDGDLRPALEAQILKLGLNDRIELPGVMSDMDSEYRAATLFVLPSRYESFGLATAEALGHGLPAVGFADCPGTNELIVDGVNGRLVSGPDRVNALADMLLELMSDSAQRQRLAGAASQSIINRFGVEYVLDIWEALLTRTVRSCAA